MAMKISASETLGKVKRYTKSSLTRCLGCTRSAKLDKSPYHWHKLCWSQGATAGKGAARTNLRSA